MDPERLILTPHNVSHSEAGRRANLALALDQILAAGRGEAPAHCVNPKRFRAGGPMSQAAYPILDADGHVTESIEQVAKYLDEPYNRRPLTSSFYPWDGWDRRLLGTLGDAAGTAEPGCARSTRAAWSRRCSIRRSGSSYHFLKDREWAVALCRAYNTFLHEEFVKKSPRLHAVALLPVQDPEAAARELRRAVTELGLVGAMLAADGTHLLGDARFLPIYEEADRLDVMLGIHASGSHLGGAGVDLFPAFIQAHTCSHAFGQMRQITSMVFEGIPERFPALRIAYLEAGCGWAPYWMERMDDEYAKRAAEAPGSSRSRATTSGAGRSSSPARPTSGCCRRR